eukprot:COSAG01_NODE_3061_length_6652_cov_18.411567_8_plen_184_part_00
MRRINSRRDCCAVEAGWKSSTRKSCDTLLCWLPWLPHAARWVEKLCTVLLLPPDVSAAVAAGAGAAAAAAALWQAASGSSGSSGSGSSSSSSNIAGVFYGLLLYSGREAIKQCTAQASAELYSGGKRLEIGQGKTVPRRPPRIPAAPIYTPYADRARHHGAMSDSTARGSFRLAVHPGAGGTY